MKSSGFFFFLQYKYVVLPTLKKKKIQNNPGPVKESHGLMVLLGQPGAVAGCCYYCLSLMGIVGITAPVTTHLGLQNHPAGWLSLKMLAS